jgi:hypothetical protein
MPYALCLMPYDSGVLLRRSRRRALLPQGVRADGLTPYALYPMPYALYPMPHALSSLRALELMVCKQGALGGGPGGAATTGAATSGAANVAPHGGLGGGPGGAATSGGATSGAANTHPAALRYIYVCICRSSKVYIYMYLPRLSGIYIYIYM